MVDGATKNFSGKEKAALIMMLLGVDDASEVTKYMNQMDVRELASIAPQVSKASEEEIKLSLEDFNTKVSSSAFLSTLGTDFSWDLIRGGSSEDEFYSLNFLQRADKNQLLEIIKYEHPQVIAFVLSYVPPDLAASIISQLPPGQQADIAFRISSMDAPNRMALRHLDRMLGEKLDFLAASGAIEVGGVESLVKILRNVGRQSERVILEELNMSHPELSEEIKNQMFVFEDIVMLDNMSIQKLMKNIDSKVLALALKRAGDEIKDLIMRNLSERARQMMEDEMSFMGKVLLREVEAAQQEIAETIRRMEESGEIKVRKEDDVYV